MGFHLLLQIFRAFENWKHFPCHRAKIYLKKARFSAFLSHGKFKLVMENSDWSRKSQRMLLPSFCVNSGTNVG